MIWLVLGVLLWSAAHLLPSAGIPLRTRLRKQLGEQPYMGLFALTIVGSVALMVVGWRATSPVVVYASPSWGRLATNLGMFVALALFAASTLPTNLKRFVRHPQLTGVLVWSLAHLLSNGEQRSLLLFGGVGLWALTAMCFINRRDTEWRKPEPQPVSADIKLAVAAVVAFVVVFFLHPYFTGMQAMPG